jgi:asparagine synthetase B (glutamine-hydrolysing)
MVDYPDSRGHHQGEPIVDSIGIPLDLVSTLTRDNGVTVIQVSEGSEERFSGLRTTRAVCGSTINISNHSGVICLNRCSTRSQPHAAGAAERSQTDSLFPQNAKWSSTKT